MKTRTTGDPRHIRLILNGKVAARAEIRAAVELLREEGHRLDVRVTWESGDAARLAQEALADGVETVVAGGGDGTLNEVVSGLVDASNKNERPRCGVGVLPLGSANDFAAGCGIPLDNPAAALRLVLETEARPIDLGLLDSRVFVNVASGGFGTKITAETAPEMKRVFGGTAYLLTGLARLGEIQPVHGKLSGPNLDWQGDFWGLAIGNGRQAGGGITACPQAILDDGLLDVTILPDAPSQAKAEKVTAFLLEGTAALERDVLRWQVSELRVEVPEGLHVNLDGEPVFESNLHFQVRPGWLRFHLPTDAPLRG